MIRVEVKELAILVIVNRNQNDLSRVHNYDSYRAKY